MTVKHSLLAILTLGPAYGLQLRDELVARAPHRAGINVGQVYGTLDRLQKGGLVASAGLTDDNLPLYALTPDGRDAARRWLRVATRPDALDWTEMLDQVLVASSVDETAWPELVDSYRAVWRSQGHAVADDGAQGDAAQDAVAASAAAAIGWLDRVEARFSRSRPSFGLSRLRPRRGRRPSLAV